MTTLVNIAAIEQNPVFIDPTAITAITCSPDGSVAIFTESGALRGYKIDQATLSAVTQQGVTPFLSFVETNEVGEIIRTTYTSPASITYATVSKPDATGTLRAIIGIKGLGRLEPTLTVDAWDKTLAVMALSGRTLLSYTADQAHARFTRPQGLYIYPDSITEMSGDGSPEQLNITFSGSGTLDVRAASYDWQNERRLCLYRAWHKAQGYNPNLIGRDVIGVKARISREVDQEVLDRRTALADQLIAANGNLLSIAGEVRQRPVCLNRHDLALVSLSDFTDTDTGQTFCLHIEKKSHTRQDRGLTAYFNTRAARDAAFADLQRQLAEQPSPQKPGTKPTSGPSA